MSKHWNKVCREVIAAAGGTGRVAAMLCVSRQAIHQWRAVPVRYVLRLEQETGISRHRMRPDIYGLPSRPDRPTEPLKAASIVALVE